MKKLLSIVPRWIPAFLLMLAIFAFSSRPDDDLPSFQGWDYLIKKGAHMIGYGLLALSYLHIYQWDKKYYWLAWLTALLYAATDEFHQSFVPGRHASVTDVLIFDNLGAMFALSLRYVFGGNMKKGVLIKDSLFSSVHNIYSNSISISSSSVHSPTRSNSISPNN